MNTAVVTGASSGIGLETTKLLLADDWKVYGLSRSEPALQNDSFVWIKCDLAQPDTIATALQKIDAATIDVLVSNAGVAFEEPASAATKASYENMFTVNVLAPMLLVNTLREKITKATIISISSVSDRLVEKNFALYCASKAANTRYFESLAEELTAAKVINLLPDYVDTPMLRELQKGRDFDWDSTIKVADVAKLIFSITKSTIDVPSGANIIIVTNALQDDLKNREKLYGFNTDTNELMKL